MMDVRALPSIVHTALHRLLFIAAIGSAVAVPASGAVAQDIAVSTEQSYDIPPQALNQALAALATAARISLVYETGQAIRLRSNGVRGRYSPATALSALLAGTGLAARFTGSRSAIVYVVGAALPAEAMATGLPSMTLDMAEIRASTIIGRSDDRGFVEYARRTQSEIRTILSDDQAYRGRPFHVRIAVVIDHAGRIGQVVLVKRRGEADQGEHLPEFLIGQRLSTPPPDGIRQPLRFDISADRISNRG